MNKLIVLLLFLCFACTPKDTNNCHYSIKFINNTDKALFIDSSSDTILKSYMDPREYFENTHVLPYAGNNRIELGSICFIRNGRPMCIEDLYKGEKKVSVFVYDSLILGKKDWNDIMINYLITKRYDFTIEELRKINFTIKYNGEHGY